MVRRSDAAHHYWLELPLVTDDAVDRRIGRVSLLSDDQEPAVCLMLPFAAAGPARGGSVDAAQIPRFQ
jgi:hypothetical protein